MRQPTSVEERKAALYREQAENQLLLTEINKLCSRTMKSKEEEYEALKQRVEELTDGGTDIPPEHEKEIKSAMRRMRECQRLHTVAGEMSDRNKVHMEELDDEGPESESANSGTASDRGASSADSDDDYSDEGGAAF